MKRPVQHVLVIVAMSLASCAASTTAVPASTPPRAPDVYRPGWTGGLELHMDEIRLCIASPTVPTFVSDVADLSSGATGITLVNEFGAEECAVLDGEVLVRRRAELLPRTLQSGLPLFALGAAPPTLAPGVLLEEVEARSGRTLGWLYWPDLAREGNASTGDLEALELSGSAEVAP